MILYKYKKLGWRLDYVEEGLRKFVAGFTFEEALAKAKKIFPTLQVRQPNALAYEVYVEPLPKE